MIGDSLGKAVLAAEHGPTSAARLFAVADAAQSNALPDALNTLGKSECLFDMVKQSELARNAPYLIELPAFESTNTAWRWILSNGPRRPCVTVLRATIAFDALLGSLRLSTEIRLPDGDDMFLAFWDPAILGSLVGQTDDTTLHIAGPILTADQRASLLDGLTGWWYWDRAASMHSIEMLPRRSAMARTPFELSQSQVNDLVEASVPDHVRYYIELNQPQLFEGMGELERYGFVRQTLAAARAIGLSGMGDLVNYTCASLIYHERMSTDPVIRVLLGRVARREINFDAAMKEFP